MKTKKIKHKLIQSKETIFQFELNSENQNNYEIPHLNEKEFFIEIDNQDNPPLQFSSIEFNQNNVIVIADLKTNQNYSIETGNPNRNMPNYDLPHFTDKYLINNTLPEAKISEIKHIQNSPKLTAAKPFWQKSWFMWFCIAIGGISILFFTASLIKDLNKNS
jgi:protease II